jgi:hypothetical protein
LVASKATCAGCTKASSTCCCFKASRALPYELSTLMVTGCLSVLLSTSAIGANRASISLSLAR